MRIWVGLAVTVVLSACSCERTVTPDGGLPSDAGGADAGALDAGALDAGWDAGVGDAGLDAGVFDAGIDAGPDLTPPEFRITVMAPPRLVVPDLIYGDDFVPKNAWRRDEDPIVAVEWSAADVDAGSVFLDVVLEADGGGLGADDGVSRINGCLCDGGCQCFMIDHARLWPVPTGQLMEYRDDLFWLRAGGADYSGNRSETGGRLLPFTRFLWEWQGALIPLSVPAIDPGGNLYAPTDDGIVSLSPFGVTRWRWTDGGPGAQPIYFPFADGGMVVFAQAPIDGGIASLRSVSALDGRELFACGLSSELSTTTSPVALSTSGRRAAVVAADGPLGRTVTAISFDSAALNGFACASATVGFGARTDVAPLGMGDRVCFSTMDNSVHCMGIDDAGTWSVPASETVVDPSGDAVMSLATAMLGNATRVFGLGNGLPSGPSGGMFLLDSTLTAEERFLPVPFSVRFGPLVIVRGPTLQPMAVYTERFGSDGIWVSELDGGLRLQVGASFSSDRIHALAGADRVNHIRGNTEQTQFRIDQASLGFYEAQRMYDTIDIETSGTIDCNRLTRRGGVFYGVTRPRMIRAILVQSPGIDTTADWPKFQRDPANSGNSVPNLLPLYTCP